MATWSDSNINKEILAQLTAARNDINVIAKDEMQKIKQDIKQAAETSYDLATAKLDGVIRQQAKEIQDLRETMLELIENAELKAKATSKAIEQDIDTLYGQQAKQLDWLKIGLIIALAINIGQIIYEIIK